MRLLSLLFLFQNWGLGCSHFHKEDDEALNLRFFFSFSFLVTLHVSFTKIAQNQSIAFCGRRDAKSTLVVRIQPLSPLSITRNKREGETVSLFSSTQSPKTKTHFVFFGVKVVFSRSSSSSSSSFEEEVEKKSNGVVWLERIRLIGQRPLRRRRPRHHREGDARIKKGFGALGTKR